MTAIVTTSDVLATSLLAEARERGIAVPGALSLTGFDDSPLAALGSPSLTSVRIDYAGFGASAAAQLLAAIAGEPPPPYEPAAAGARRARVDRAGHVSSGCTIHTFGSQ